MQARMQNPVLVFPDVLQAMLAVDKSTSGIDYVTRKLVHLRASQINGCGVCVDMHARELRKAGVTDDRIFAVGAWRETPYFSEPERAALVIQIALINFWNRLNCATRQIAGKWK